MKKAVSILLIMVIAFAPLTASASPFDGLIRPININTSGLKPAAFSNVEYKIRGDVVRVNSEELLPMIKSEEQIREGTKQVDLTPGEIISNIGYIKDSQLKSIKSDYKLGTVLVDEKNQTAVKINSLPEEVEEAQEFSNYVAVEKPEVYEVLEHFKIPKQTVKLNLANISAFGEGMEECAAYISQAFGLEAKVGKSKFTDIPPMHPYLPQINAAVEAGLISGYSDTKFGTFDSISREQMASIIMRGMKSKYGNKLSITGSAMQFKDMGRINSWAKQSVNEISALGIMKGSTDGSFNPQGKVTFNEVAVILNNLDTYMQQH